MDHSDSYTAAKDSQIFSTKSWFNLVKEIEWLRISWVFMLLLYGVTGILAATVSFIFERELVIQLFGRPVLATLLTTVFESFKVLTVLIYGIFHYTKHETPMAASLSALVNFTKFGLVCSSAAASLFFISGQLDRPHLEEVRAERIATTNSAYEKQVSELKAQAREKTTELAAGFEKDKKDLKEKLIFWQNQAVEESRAVREEAGDIVNGVSKGPEWHALSDQKDFAEGNLREAEQTFNSDLKFLRTEYHNNLTALDDELNKKIEQVTAEKELKTTELRRSDLAEEPSVHNPMFYSGLRAINHSLFRHVNLKLAILDATFFISLIISLLLESIIYVSLNALVIAFSAKFDLAFEVAKEEKEAKKKL